MSTNTVMSSKVAVSKDELEDDEQGNQQDGRTTKLRSLRKIGHNDDQWQSRLQLQIGATWSGRKSKLKVWRRSIPLVRWSSLKMGKCLFWGGWGTLATGWT